MEEVQIRALNKSTYEVTVQARTPTTHIVTVSNDDANRLTGGDATPLQLVEQSFQFLLQREPNTSILRRFDLPLIGHYFPEYERVIRAMLTAR